MASVTPSLAKEAVSMRFSLASLASIVGLALAGSASATVLTFDWGGNSLDAVPANYGNRVGDPNFPTPPGYSYGAAGGITPNVNILYAPTLRLGAATPPDPTRVFGDLTNVLYRQRAPDNGLAGILQIDFIADPGFQVCLQSFDIAAVFNSVSGFGEDLPARNIKVLDGQGNALFSLDYDPAVLDHDSLLSTYAPGTNTPLRHKTFVFNPPLTASKITLRLDFTQLLTIGGNKSDRIAIDNIQFCQTPTPGAATLIGCTGVMLASRRRRR
jgi:hypothetical protein